jgi:hypothetical protein
MSLSLITLELVLRNILLNDSWLLGPLVPKPPHTPCMQRTHFLCASPPHPSPVPPYNAMSASHICNKQWERPNVSIPTHTHGTIPNCGWPIHHKEWI